MYLPLAFAWTAGATAASALTDGRVDRWLPDVGVLASTFTMVVGLLLLRALDDIRDRDYDRRHNPDRPLAAGSVAVPDLLVLIAVGSVLILSVNAWRWPVMCVLAGLLAYAFLVVWVDQRLGWPSGDAMLVGLLVSLPVQLLINAYLYAAMLYSAGLAPSLSGAVGIVVVTLAFLHVEFARKTTRRPRHGERTYVRRIGVTGTVVVALGCAVGSVGLLIAATRPWHAVVLLAVVPLVFPALAAVRFHRDRATRWPYGLAALFVITSYVGFALIALLRGAFP